MTIWAARAVSGLAVFETYASSGSRVSHVRRSWLGARKMARRHVSRVPIMASRADNGFAS